MRYDLCADHADALTVPKGWALQDRRVRYPARPRVLAPPDFRGGHGPAYPAPVNEVATAPVPAPPKVQRWGIPDALVGWVVVYLVAEHLVRRGRQPPPATSTTTSTTSRSASSRSAQLGLAGRLLRRPVGR